jgi:hypothetical protein
MTIMKSIAQQLLDAYGVTRLLRDNAAIILESLAVEALCPGTRAIARPLSMPSAPASSLAASSVSFDNRIKICRAKDLPLDEIYTIIKLVGECVVGKIADDGIDIDAYDLCLSSEIRSAFGDLHPDSRMIYGAFPEWDCTPNSAITFILPDEDGVFCAYPH